MIADCRQKRKERRKGKKRTKITGILPKMLDMLLKDPFVSDDRAGAQMVLQPKNRRKERKAPKKLKKIRTDVKLENFIENVRDPDATDDSSEYDPEVPRSDSESYDSEDDEGGEDDMDGAHSTFAQGDQEVNVEMAVAKS